MAKQLPHVRYTKELIHKGRGYPFWYPEPDSSAPDEFKERGICPGDVGIINNDGGFDFLFSIFSGANGLPQLAQQDVQIFPVHGNVLKSQHVSNREVSIDVSTQGLQSIADVGARFDLSVSEGSAAILLLPDNSTRYKDLRKAVFEEYAQRHGESWYDYANRTLGRKAPNGSLYLITECDKTTTWGNAVIGRTDRRSEFSLRCTLMNVVGGAIQVAESWINDSDIENGLFPIPSAQYSYPIGLKNQCIFARGIIISLSKSLFKKSWKVVPHLIDGSFKDRIPSFDTRNAPLPQNDGGIGGGTSRFFGSKTPQKNSDFDQRGMLVESADHELLVAEVSEFPTAESELLNPSAAMNEYLLSKDPSLEIAITHDEEWMEVMQQYEKDTYLTEEELWSKLKDCLDAKISTLSGSVGMPSNMSQDTALVRDRDISSQASFIEAKPLPKHQVHLSGKALYEMTSSLAQHGKVDGQKFWAVIIGIDGYETSPLRGCVSDAEMVAKYLIDDLHVPENHIQLLLSTDSKKFTESVNKPVSPCGDFAVELTDERISKPTHANIIEAILGLSTNTDIQHGENILIYFAGYGTAYKCADYPPYEKDTAAVLGTIEALCPIDRHGPKPTATGSTKTPDTNDARSSEPSDPQVPDISDREINTILAEIARKKGNHITFILDCCHSFSITRGPQPEGVRAIAPLPSSSIAAMFSAADETLKDIAGYQSISEANWRAKMDSHVVLAACKEFEYAKEGTVEGDSRFNGAFTRALISAFKSADLNDTSMTYYKLIATLPKNDTQHPVIAGKHKESRLWFQDDDSSNT